MADKTEETTAEETPDASSDGITEDDLRKLIGEVVEEKLSTISEGLGGLADGIFDRLKGSSDTSESLLEKIGSLIDEKFKNMPSGENGKKEHTPKIRIFG